MISRDIIQIILLNVYYLGVAVAFLVKDILWLRVIMIIAGFCMISQAILGQNLIIIGWVSLFTMINIIQVIIILHENRDIKLNPDLNSIYEMIFKNLTKREFQLLWEKSEREFIDAEKYLCRDGDELDRIILIISGNALVSKNGRTAAQLKTGSFVAEMSYLTHLPTSADVIATSATEIRFWTHKTLQRIERLYPDLHNKFQLVLSRDLTNKLKNYL